MNKKIVLTQDYSIGIPVLIGKKQIIQWGGIDITITSEISGGEITIQLDLLEWKEKAVALALQKNRESYEP